MLKKSFLLLGCILVTACSSTPSQEDIAKDQAKAAEILAKSQQKERDRRQEKMEDELSEVPAWALSTPQPDADGIYAVGISESNKMSMAIKKATLEAEFGLAKLYNQELSGSERMFSKDDNSTVSQEQYVQLIDKLVTQVSVVGHQVVKQEVKPIDGQYHAFIMLKLPFQQFNKVLNDQRSKTKDSSIKAAFDDLERRIKSRQTQLSEAEKSSPIGNSNQADVTATDSPKSSKLTINSSITQ